MKTNFMSAVCLILLLALIWLPGTVRDTASVMSPRLAKALDGEGPWVVWVFFGDKGLSGAALREALDAAQDGLTDRAASRRRKGSWTGGRLVDEADLAVNPDYLARAGSTGAVLRQSSRWLNAASYLITRTQARQMSRLECVERMDLVNRSRCAGVPTPVGDPVPVFPRSGTDKGLTSDTVDYGGNLGAMVQVNVPALHNVGLSGRGVLVGMLDTGFHTAHEALQGIPVLGTWDFVNDDSDVDNEDGDPTSSRDHGTMTLSTVAGNKPGSLVGPAYGVSVVLAKTEDVSQEVPVEEDYWVAGLEWVESLGADIVSSSLGYFDWYEFADLDGNTAVTTIAADLAVGRGLLVVNSAGNSRLTTGTLVVPSDGDSVLTVGAVDSNGLVTSFSSPGPTADGRIKPNVAALGLSNTVANPWDDQGYLAASGTSFSCPLTSGVAALMLERVPQLTPMQVIEALQQTASQSLTPDNDLGWGIVDAWAAATWFGPVIDHQRLSATEDMVGPYVVTAVITDRVGVDPAYNSLVYRVNGGSWTTVSLSAAGEPDTYTADIPGQASTALVEYYLEASGVNGFDTARPYQGAQAPFSFTVGVWRMTDYATTPSVAIPDKDDMGVSSVINVPVEESGSIVDVTVDIGITHPDRGELQVLLEGPDGIAVTLHDHSGSGLADLIGNWPATLTVDGPGGLEDWLDVSNAGDWTLTVIDNRSPNTGTLDSWGLHFTLAPTVSAVPEGIPARIMRLDPNVPNPFNPRTEISFALERSGQTRLSIFDVRGMLVRQLLDQGMSAGFHTVVWDGKNGLGRAVSSGTYMYRLESGSEVQVRKMLLVR